MKIPFLGKIAPQNRNYALYGKDQKYRKEWRQPSYEKPFDYIHDEVDFDQSYYLTVHHLSDPEIRDLKGVVHSANDQIQYHIKRYHQPVTAHRKLYP